ncbi:MAG: hypothetical protein ACJAV1_002943, partial [Paraglaciecola sp.]
SKPAQKITYHGIIWIISVNSQKTKNQNNKAGLG